MLYLKELKKNRVRFCFLLELALFLSMGPLDSLFSLSSALVRVSSLSVVLQCTCFIFLVGPGHSVLCLWALSLLLNACIGLGLCPLN